MPTVSICRRLLLAGAAPSTRPAAPAAATRPIVATRIGPRCSRAAKPVYAARGTADRDRCADARWVFGGARRRSLLAALAEESEASCGALLTSPLPRYVVDARHSSARRRSARASRGPVTTINGRYRAEEGALHVLSAHPDRWRYRGVVAEVMTSGVPATRLPVGLLRRARGPRDTRSKTPARRCHGGGHEPARGRGGIPAAKHASVPQLDVAGILARGCLDDSAIPASIRRSPTARAGQPPLALCNDLTDRGERLAMLGPHAGEQRAAPRQRAARRQRMSARAVTEPR